MTRVTGVQQSVGKRGIRKHGALISRPSGRGTAFLKLLQKKYTRPEVICILRGVCGLFQRVRGSGEMNGPQWS